MLHDSVILVSCQFGEQLIRKPFQGPVKVKAGVYDYHRQAGAGKYGKKGYDKTLTGLHGQPKS